MVTPGVLPDLQSVIKKCPNLLGSADLQSAAKEYAFPFVGGITNPPVLIGRTFFTADCKSAGTPSGLTLLYFVKEM